MMVSRTARRIALYSSFIVSLVVVGLWTTAHLRSSGEKRAEQPEVSKPRPQDSDGKPRPNALVQGMRVLAFEGKVDKVSTSSQAVDPLRVGALLEGKEGVRTGESSRVRLAIGGRSTVELKERGELQILGDEENGQILKLMGGRVDIDYNEPGKRIRIESRDGDAVAATEEGLFTVLQAGETIAVATRTGKVDLSSGASEVEVPQGFQSIVSNGSVSDPQPMPVDLLLRVVDPGCIVQRESFIVLSGRSSPGARVMADGVLASVTLDGRFFVRVPLHRGRNDIEVVSEDAAGHRKTRSFSCVTVDPSAPINEIKIKWGPTTKSSPSS
ncbi:MAG: FecR family protein [Myxococcota bacterium]|jgi:hypothetical protein|nr:FecR family protein [Myxococcota bacterium]